MLSSLAVCACVVRIWHVLRLEEDAMLGGGDMMLRARAGRQDAQADLSLALPHVLLLLQGAALAELQALFPALAGTGSSAAKTEALLSALLDEGRGRRDGGGSTDGSARQAQHSVAQCCAVLVVPAGQAQVDATVKQLLQMLKSADQGRWSGNASVRELGRLFGSSRGCKGRGC
jgi:hypothetical protein